MSPKSMEILHPKTSSEPRLPTTSFLVKYFKEDSNQCPIEESPGTLLFQSHSRPVRSFSLLFPHGVSSPHKAFIYSNDLDVPRVPGRLALETGRGTGDRLSFLSDLLSRGLCLSHLGSHGGGFRPLTPFSLVVHDGTESHDRS